MTLYSGIPICNTEGSNVHPLNEETPMTAATPKFVEVRTKTKVYQVPKKYAELPSISAIIRAMAKDGYTRWGIHKQTGILYQHVRNVLITPLAG